jgi:tRNA A37 threonylcarbamoyltransferase TsaD
VQQAIVDVLVIKTLAAAATLGLNAIVIGGGVSANSLLRTQFKINGKKNNIKIVMPDLSYCMDNAAMIGLVAEMKYRNCDINLFKNLDFRVDARALRINNKKNSNKIDNLI